ncbi:toxin-activating lysine-acyltransferase [Rhodoferax saidenbachensis]|uniref:RTX toxin-activating lysine-acyltransferase n=1 Tax=Rhodoferax saidenbachensis TaxID=1484693 RepID=A0ABU1ZUR0_9BURK|nr:toxin-activating lysine-acyltransferase [Rhodoferax saidenbachensis]MDR7308266.1 cytolysin-activating lysine-acyltransferase [Rhodoferax saidenbachensis]
MNTSQPTEKEGSPNEAMSSSELADFAALLKKQAQRVVGKLPLLGAVGWLMMQQTATRHTLLSELEWRVMPALVLDQAKLYMRDDSPIAYVSWATLSEPVAQRYSAAPHQLTASDWQSGEQVWIVDLFVPFGGAQEVMNDLRTTVFAGRPVHQLHMGADGRLKSMTWPAQQGDTTPRP